MAEASRRAARSAAKGGRPNALFVVGAAERLPAELVGLADDVTIVLPWGSLLRGVLGLDEAAARGIASLPKPGASVTAWLASSARYRGAGVGTLDGDLLRPAALARLAAVHGRTGLVLVEAAPAPPAELRTLGSTWAKRLGLDRPGSGSSAVRLRLVRGGGR
jgi:16S rRNA (adenine(1408)-N(1))-methyltransferase